MSNKLLEKFNEALQLHEDVSSYSKKDIVIEEMVTWKRAKRKGQSYRHGLKLKLQEITGLSDKNLELNIDSNINSDSKAHETILKFISNYNFKRFFGTSRDFCNLSVFMKGDYVKVEGYRMFELTSRLQGKGIQEILNGIKDSFQGRVKLINKNYGKNEKAVEVLIVGFHYVDRKRELSIGNRGLEA